MIMEYVRSTKTKEDEAPKRETQITCKSIDFLDQLLPEIVITHILPRVDDYTSWVRATCVCKAWRDLFRQVPPPPDIPWLWLTDPQCNASFFSPFPASASPQPKDVWVGSAVASHRQYLLCIDPPPSRSPPSTPRTITIHNPFTGQTIRLPPQPLRTPRLDLGALACLPTKHSTSIFVAAIADVDGCIHSCRRGNSKWASSRNISVERVFDIIFWRGLLYLISVNGTIFSLDVVDNPTQLPRIIIHWNESSPLFLYRRNELPSLIFSYYLVESCYGELLVVTRYRLPSHLGYAAFTVHRYAGKKKLVQVKDLGEQMLFLGRGCSRSARFGSRVWQSDFFTKNSIYFCYRDGSSGFRLGKFVLGDFKSCSSVVFHPDQISSAFRLIWITQAPR